MLRKRLVRLLALAIALLPTESTRADSSWQFTDIDGVIWKPFDDKATQAIVLTFIATDCPIANSYHPLLGRMADNYRKNGICFFMFHSDPNMRSETVRKHQLEYDIQVPIILDSNQSIARRVGATVTPQAFIIVRDKAAPAYQGRIDDLYVDYGRKRTAATRHDLADALESIISGKVIERSRTDAVGCFISFQESAPATRTLIPAVYDPLKADGQKIETLELTVIDNERSRRIPVRVYLPESGQPAAVIVHSHGLGGTKETSSFLGKHWAARGYVSVFVQHPGSDAAVWTDIPQPQRMIKLRKAASGRNLNLRTGDVRAVIDQLENWNSEESHALRGRMNMNQVGMSGHSFGALTTQHLAGQLTMGTARSVDSRIRAAIPMSPSAPAIGDPKKVFGEISIPWLCMTGTLDVAPIGNTDVESRLAVFAALPPGDKYELVLKDAEHSVFTERILPGEKRTRNPNHHRAIKAITTAFWDSFLRDDNLAKTWLNGDEVRIVLDPEDRLRRK